MAKKPGRYCVVFNSATVGVKDRLVGRYSKKADAERAKREANRTAGMGGFYSAHVCKNLGYEARKALGLEGRRR